ncbi:MAG TPA: glycogen/starch/alpha-glucan phosphorylase [Candidatus Macondimonas sp.]|nr:glycogen/starch/alpha-glucan phosphorylase [Candidatus Macondimonas sp.]
MDGMTKPQLDTFPEDERTGLDKDVIKRAFLDHLFFSQGKFPALATMNDYYLALAYTVRDRMLHRWISTAAAYTEQGARTVCYLSAEFLLGTHLGNNLINLGIYAAAREAVEELGLDFPELLRQEEEPGLGNGGLGRLAACFLDSMATLEIPSLGYGIRYEFGIFDQDIVDGWQVEKTDKWLRFGNPWEIQRAEWAVEVMLGGHTEHYRDEHDQLRVRWVPHRVIKAMPYDTPILGYRNCTANTLRLWRAEAPESFDFSVFNRGDYYGAVDRKIISENITKVLYPNDEAMEGKALRLEQQYFLVSASLQDMFRILDRQHVPVTRFHEKFAAQMNDTHPALAVAELMRLLIDVRHLPWDTAWEITQKTLAYTNHTLLPEALEQWPLDLFRRLLPRHLEIIYEINDRFLEQVRVRYLGDPERVARLSLINEHGARSVRMAHLACVGSHAINGVAALHTELLKQTVLKDFHDLWPEKFSNKTNGVTPRRWVFLSNPRLTRLITEAIGPGWTTDLALLERLAPLAEDSDFRERWQAVKQANKADLARFVDVRFGERIDPATLFDVQVKRIHEYKRQHLNALHIVATYLRLKNDPGRDFVPRTYLFGGKAAPGYHMAKLIIKLINSVGSVVNSDPDVAGRLKVFFMPNFHVSNGQRIYPAADLSEQISTAGKEASGTGNMKFTLNGALTIGTLDGANVEIRERVGAENFFLFGHTEAQIAGLQRAGYRPGDLYHGNEELKAVIDLIGSGYFSRGDRNLFRPLIDNLLHHDPFFVLADFAAYLACQDQVDMAYRDRDGWNRMAILNTARAGVFSSDRSIREYQQEIWKVPSVPITLIDPDDVKVSVMQ